MGRASRSRALEPAAILNLRQEEKTFLPQACESRGSTATDQAPLRFTWSTDRVIRSRPLSLQKKMKYSISKNTALIIIDVQQGLDDPKWGRRNNPKAEANISRLISLWRSEKRSVIHIQHCSMEPDSPLRPELPGYQFKPEATPIEGEFVFKKTVNSAFIGTELESHLRGCGIEHIVIVGLTTDHCVSTTTRMAGNLGFKVLLVSDATATFDRIGPDGKKYRAEDIHAIHIASLNGEFCDVITTDTLIPVQEKSITTDFK